MDHDGDDVRDRIEIERKPTTTRRVPVLRKPNGFSKGDERRGGGGGGGGGGVKREEGRGWRKATKRTTE